MSITVNMTGKNNKRVINISLPDETDNTQLPSTHLLLTLDAIFRLILHVDVV